MKNILLSPIITEKSMMQVADDKYTFRASDKANKAEIADFLAKYYKVKVISVKIINQLGKIKNFRGRPSGRTQNYKKAIIKIAKGQKIAEFSIKE